MNSFTFRNTTKIVFGKGADSKAGALAAAVSKKVLLHWGQGSAERSGLLGRVRASLDAAGVEWAELGGARPNPRLSLVRKGIELCRDRGIGLVLAVGGGSVIDSAKAIAAGVPYSGDVWDFYAGKAAVNAALPVGCVLTIPAAGSETSGSTVITNEDGPYKRGLTSDDFLRPVFAIMDPALTATLPPRETAIGAADIMSHAMERYFTNVTDTDYSDRLLEATMRSVAHNLPRVLAAPGDIDARAELMWTGTLAHNDLFGMGRVGDWASHDIEHELSAIYDVPHGAGLAVVFPAWMKYVHGHDDARFARWAERVWDAEDDYRSPARTALEGIRRLEAFYASCGLATRLAGLGVGPERFAEMAAGAAAKATSDGARTIGNFVKLDGQAIVEILKLAL
jgi:alcohol dehydrogenase